MFSQQGPGLYFWRRKPIPKKANGFITCLGWQMLQYQLLFSLFQGRDLNLEIGCCTGVSTLLERREGLCQPICTLSCPLTHSCK